jgi:Holliday junction resolvasome RuvABC endonuclease subunit
MTILGIDAGLTAPGFAVVARNCDNLTGDVLMAECFIPKHDKNLARKTDRDADRIRQIVSKIFELVYVYKPTVIVAELPTGGSKSGAAARGMAYSVAMTVSALCAVTRFIPTPIEIVYITPMENKKGSTGKVKWDVETDQGKWEVLQAVKAIWPNVIWPQKRKSIEIDDAKCWAIADALSTIATYLRRKGVKLEPVQVPE